MTVWRDDPEERVVSRETRDRLAEFEALLKKWNPAINLVARSTLHDIERRHLQDSIQVFDLAPENAGRWVDIGSGGGFPGLIVAILAVTERPDLKVTLIESDQRKAAFLTNAVRQLGLSVTIIADRAEALAPLCADVVSARALAPLDALLALSERHLAPGGVALFPKGANHQQELNQALESWTFTYHKEPSRTEPDAVILSIGGIARV